MSKAMILVAAAALVALLAACSGDDPPTAEIAPQPLADGYTDYTGVDAPKPTPQIAPPSESYALREIQKGMAPYLMGMFINTVFPYHANPNIIHDGFAFAGSGCGMNPYSWTPSDQRINFGPEGENACLAITFTGVHYNADTNLTYGEPTVDEGPPLNLTGSSADRRVDNRQGSVPRSVELEESFEIDQTVSSSFSTDFAVDVTLESKSTFKSGGGEVGPSFEQELTATFGSHFEEQREKTTEQSTAQTDSFKVSYDVPAGKDVMATFSHEKLTTRVPYNVNGFYDFGITITINNNGRSWWDNSRNTIGGAIVVHDLEAWNLQSRYQWYNRCFATDDNPGWKNRIQHDKAGWAQLKYDSLDDYLDMFRGVNVRWPRFGDSDCNLAAGIGDYHGIWPGISTWMETISDPDWRKIVLSGEQVRQSASSTTLRVLDLSHCSEGDANSIEDRVNDGDGSNYDEIFSNVQDTKCTDGVSTYKTGGSDRAPVPSPNGN